MNEETIFAQAAAMSADERAAFLEEACQDNARLRARIEALLKAHDNPDEFLNASAARVAATEDSPRITEGPGDQIGPYKLLQQIGEGGMGVVYMAEQREPVRRKVALKIIKPGMDTRHVIARFEAERQALAMMDHPNIAKVLDAGTTESGRPYFAMELVHGIPITEFCDEQQLTTEERLDLFASVCHAVQHAHQKGIIHRDLKPSNILVAMYDGKVVPKVIDFGVAKATSQTLTDRTLFTQFGQIVGTLEYMSPEQAQRNQLDIDTRSDIYSLGVVLYELLTGETPFERQRLRSAALDELLRIIREEEPPRPSTKLRSSQSLPAVAANRRIQPLKLPTLVRGELDLIVMKAIDKDRGQRYETANAFAADIRRYLENEPVEACPPSAVYRFKKLVRRNKVAISTVAVLLLALLVGLAGTAWQAYEKSVAEHELLGTLERLEQSLVDEGLTQALTGESARALRIADDLASFGAELPATKLRILVWIMEGKLDQARDRIESALAENPEAIGLQAMRVLVHDAAGNYQEFRLAVHELDLANLKYAQPEDYVFLAKSAQGADFARKMAAKAFETCRSPFSMLLRGRTEADYANETGNTQKRDQIVKDIESAAHLMPSAPAVRIERLASYLLLANACRANGDEESYKRYLQAASDAADSIAQQKKPFAWELIYLAEFYYERGRHGDFDKAAACYRQVMETFHSDIHLVYYAGLLAELSVDSPSLQFVAVTQLPSRGPVSDTSIAFLNLVAGNEDTAVRQAKDAVVEYDLSDADILGLSVLHMAGKSDQAETLAKSEMEKSRNTWVDVRGSWPLSHVIAYLADERLESSLLEDAEQSGCRRHALMYAHWAIGCRALGEGNTPKATEHFGDCAGQGMINQGYNYWARAMVKILEANAWPPSRDQGTSL